MNNRIKLSQQVRRVVERCSMSLGEIQRATGIDKATLSRFLSGERGLPIKTLDRLADLFDLKITVGRHEPYTEKTMQAKKSKKKREGFFESRDGKKPGKFVDWCEIDFPHLVLGVDGKELRLFFWTSEVAAQAAKATSRIARTMRRCEANIDNELNEKEG